MLKRLGWKLELLNGNATWKVGWAGRNLPSGSRQETSSASALPPRAEARAPLQPLVFSAPPAGFAMGPPVDYRSGAGSVGTPRGSLLPTGASWAGGLDLSLGDRGSWSGRGIDAPHARAYMRGVGPPGTPRGVLSALPTGYPLQGLPPGPAAAPPGGLFHRHNAPSETLSRGPEGTQAHGGGVATSAEGVSAPEGSNLGFGSPRDPCDFIWDLQGNSSDEAPAGLEAVGFGSPPTGAGTAWGTGSLSPPEAGLPLPWALATSCCSEAAAHPPPAAAVPLLPIGGAAVPVWVPVQGPGDPLQVPQALAREPARSAFARSASAPPAPASWPMVELGPQAVPQAVQSWQQGPPVPPAAQHPAPGAPIVPPNVQAVQQGVLRPPAGIRTRPLAPRVEERGAMPVPHGVLAGGAVLQPVPIGVWAGGRLPQTPPHLRTARAESLPIPFRLPVGLEPRLLAPYFPGPVPGGSAGFLGVLPVGSHILYYWHHASDCVLPSLDWLCSYERVTRMGRVVM